MNEIPLENQSGKLYISSLYALSDIEKNNIHVVISLCPTFQSLNVEHHYKYSIADSSDLQSVETMKHILEETRNNIDTFIKKGKNVLVHCHAGISRSSTVVIDYICAFYYFPNCISQTDCTYEYVKFFRPIIRPNDGFYKLLKSLYN